MGSSEPSRFTTALAGVSSRCPVCNCARHKQAGLAFWVVKTFEGVCPFCRAYRRVHGRQSHEPVPETEAKTDPPRHRDSRLA